MKQSWLRLAITTHSSSRYGQQCSVLHLCVSNASISILKKITSISFLVIKAARIDKVIDLNYKSLDLAGLVSVG